MKLLLKITKNELRNLFYSPVAWILMLLFLGLCSYTYTASIYPWAKQTEQVLKNDPLWLAKVMESVTFTIFNSPGSGFFPSILPHIYLFIPLLTMSIISREINNGTIRLLYSSPVTIRQIVLGKYIALMIYNLVFVAIPAIFVISGCFDISHFDIGPQLSSLFGFYLLLCALTAIGFYMSSLTTYPIVAAVASFTVLIVLVYVGRLWQQYDIVRDLTWFLSINNRVDKMMSGLISSKDVVYYLVIMFMFVGFTMLKLKDGREAKPWYVKAGRYLTVIIIGLGTGYISSRPQFIAWWDTERREMNTIHPVTQSILKELNDGPLEVTFYSNLMYPGFELGLPANRNGYMTMMWEKYQRFKKDMDFKFVYFYDLLPEDSAVYKMYPGKTLQQIAGITAAKNQVDSSLFMAPEEFRKIADLKDESLRSIMELKYKGKKTFLRLYNGGGAGGGLPAEMQVNAALKRLTGAPMLKVYYVSGELERSIYKKGEREYNNHVANKLNGEALINLGFDTDTLNLQTQSIPADADIVALADPRMELSTVALQKLEKYIDEGRNMLILGEPGKQYVLNPLLKKLDLHLMEGQLAQSRMDETAEKINYWNNPASDELAPEWWMLYYKHLRANKVPDGPSFSKMYGTTALTAGSDSGFTATPLFTTASDDVWLKKGKMVIDSVPPVFTPQEGDIKALPFSLFLQLTRKINNREQRIIVGADADFISNSRLDIQTARGFYSWLCYNKAPYYTPIPYATDNYIKCSAARAEVYNIAYVWVLPALILLTGMIILTRRKRK